MCSSRPIGDPEATRSPVAGQIENSVFWSADTLRFTLSRPTPIGLPSQALRYIEEPEALLCNNAVRLLRHGREAFPAWLAAIDAATTRISLEMYIFNDDKIGRRFAEGLSKAAHRGVEGDRKSTRL